MSDSPTWAVSQYRRGRSGFSQPVTGVMAAVARMLSQPAPRRRSAGGSERPRRCQDMRQTTALAADAAMESFLRATDVLDWREPDVLGLARSLAAGRRDPFDVSCLCFEWVRDEIRRSALGNARHVALGCW